MNNFFLKILCITYLISGSSGGLFSKKQCYCDPGIEGPNGIPGKRGPTGIGGERGEKGARGAPGSPGRTGRPGITGEFGVQGGPGPRGESGIVGPPGLPGPPATNEGHMGPRGKPGKNGKAGKPGKKGKTGSRGKRGSPGSPGKPGAPGEVIYYYYQLPKPPAPHRKPGKPSYHHKPGKPGKPGSDHYWEPNYSHHGYPEKPIGNYPVVVPKPVLTGIGNPGVPEYPGTQGVSGGPVPGFSGTGSPGFPATGHPAMPGTTGYPTTGRPPMPGTTGYPTTGGPPMAGTPGFPATGGPTMTGHPGFPATGGPAMPGTSAFPATGGPAIPGSSGGPQRPENFENIQYPGNQPILPGSSIIATRPKPTVTPGTPETVLTPHVPDIQPGSGVLNISGNSDNLAVVGGSEVLGSTDNTQAYEENSETTVNLDEGAEVTPSNPGHYDNELAENSQNSLNKGDSAPNTPGTGPEHFESTINLESPAHYENPGHEESDSDPLPSDSGLYAANSELDNSWPEATHIPIIFDHEGYPINQENDEILLRPDPSNELPEMPSEDIPSFGDAENSEYPFNPELQTPAIATNPEIDSFGNLPDFESPGEIEQHPEILEDPVSADFEDPNAAESEGNSDTENHENSEDGEYLPTDNFDPPENIEEVVNWDKPGNWSVADPIKLDIFRVDRLCTNGLCSGKRKPQSSYRKKEKPLPGNKDTNRKKVTIATAPTTPNRPNKKPSLLGVSARHISGDEYAQYGNMRNRSRHVFQTKSSREGRKLGGLNPKSMNQMLSDIRRDIAVLRESVRRE